MGTMSASLPNTLRAFVEEQVSTHAYGTSNEYVCELIRKDQDRQRLLALLLEGVSSEPSTPANAHYFKGLRDRVQKHR